MIYLSICNSMKTVTLNLTYEEAETWRLLKEAGIFNLSNGSAELHFNSQGQLAKIDTHLAVFRRVQVVLPKQVKAEQYVS